MREVPGKATARSSQTLRARRAACFSSDSDAPSAPRGVHMLVRPALADSDAAALLAVERAAFGGDDEADLVAALLADPSAVPIINLVAERGRRDRRPRAVHPCRRRGPRTATSPRPCLAPLAVAPPRKDRASGRRSAAGHRGRASSSASDSSSCSATSATTRRSASRRRRRSGSPRRTRSTPRSPTRGWCSRRSPGLLGNGAGHGALRRRAHAPGDVGGVGAALPRSSATCGTARLG